MKTYHKKLLLLTTLLTGIGFSYYHTTNLDIHAEEYKEQAESQKITLRKSGLLRIPKNLPQEYFYDSGIHIDYPIDGVKGIYTQANAIDEGLSTITNLLTSTNLNAIVLDVRDDYGKITVDLPVENPYIKPNMTLQVSDTQAMMKSFEEHQIYPIARIVSFKDSRLAFQHPELSFIRQNGTVWTNHGGEAFVNPFNKETWKYAVDVAIGAAKIGFKEIQLDYVRFPEGFENFEQYLTYDKGDYADYEDDNAARVAVITDFVQYVHEALKPFGVKLSVDLFGYATTIDEAGGIGQNFSKIAQNVDVISAMIYPSHWGDGSFGVINPDLHPYEIVYGYMQLENERLANVNPSPISRPWLQDFTASYLTPGTYQAYGPEQVREQIDALEDAGVKEYLLWNAQTSYSKDTDY
ncbi:hypothetical protein SAMN05421767_11126 [Granulicatella balaenopterae]|uniref:DUF4015 domain-containing protein n=1 Tax=Granulicatella balaenopterae TaxID=137733 RepID=A0A1H9K0E0_9LACT|nr:putative glycoside hydrolase [Granulicatella balaenopterae]SEQ92582.1 hypothetical protein SAMN05421767_11126 [Granulicatella balaenopterae]